jgi:hypothetical protein
MKSKICIIDSSHKHMAKNLDKAHARSCPPRRKADSVSDLNLMEVDPFCAGYHMAELLGKHANILDAIPETSAISVSSTLFVDNERRPEVEDFPWDLRLPPCQRRIFSFGDLEKYMDLVPILGEAYKMTYYPEDDRLTDRYRKLRDVMNECRKIGAIFFIANLKDLGLPEEFGGLLDWSIGITNLRGLAFLTTLYFAYAVLYRKTDQDAKEEGIVESFLGLIENGFPGCPERCPHCQSAKP